MVKVNKSTFYFFVIGTRRGRRQKHPKLNMASGLDRVGAFRYQ